MKKEFDRSVFLILLCFYLSYLGYILFPALGPRFYLNNVQPTELNGLFITEHVQRILNQLEGIKRDAFPSGHTAITVLVLCLAYRYNKGYFRIALPVVSALIFATVYCRYHYVIDVIAGFVLTFLTLVLGERYYAWWEQRQAGFKSGGKRKTL
jgi:membrane-associated phospholipid phosphatase